jgi:hypothetical protein
MEMMPQRIGEDPADLVVLVRGEEGDDAGDRLARVGGVQRGEDGVAGVGGLEHRLHRLLVADLAEHHHVRILPQHVTERLVEGVRVGAHLALADQRELVAVEELDRVLDGDDVGRPVLVEVPEHGGERGRLAAPVTPVTSTSPRGESAICSSTGGELQLRQRRDLDRDRAEGEAEGAALLEQVHAEAAEALHTDGEVDLLALGELLALLGVRICSAQRLHVLRPEHRGAWSP